MMRLDLLFIGVLNTATKIICMNYLSGIEPTEGRRQRIVVVLKNNGVPTMISYVWMDCDRRYFISTVSSPL